MAPPRDVYPGLKDLTFGVELEFFTAMKMAKFRRTGYETLRHFIGAKIDALELRGPIGRGVRAKVIEAEELEWDDKAETDYRYWTVTRDHTIEPDYPDCFDDYEAQPMELISPPYHVRLPYWEQDLKALLSTAVDPRQNPDLYCELNTSAHLHVHIGNGTSGEEFPYHTIRNLAMLAIVFEAEIDKMLADHMGFSTETSFARSQRKSPAFIGLSVASMARKIRDECQSIDDVIEMMDPELPGMENDADFRRYFKYNFWSLKSAKKTVEFRQHQGSLSAVEIIHWVRFVTSLVELANSISDQDLERLIHQTDWEHVSITELFACMTIIAGHLPMPIETVQYYTRLVHARGGHARTKTHLRIRKMPSGQKILTWLPLTPSEVNEEAARLAVRRLWLE
ncbi:MAG: hypothetical protein M1835_001036 [Candelina submexicana]|nr:MAG: hypothetical protein M1835_001036 [Candelina submexicana]